MGRSIREHIYDRKSEANIYRKREIIWPLCFLSLSQIITEKKKERERGNELLYSRSLSRRWLYSIRRQNKGHSESMWTASIILEIILEIRNVSILDDQRVQFSSIDVHTYVCIIATIQQSIQAAHNMEIP